MSKHLSYTQLTAVTEQTLRNLRKHLDDAAAYRAAGDYFAAHAEWIAAHAVYCMWSTLVVRHLDALYRAAYVGDITRLDALMNLAGVPAAATP